MFSPVQSLECEKTLETLETPQYSENETIQVKLMDTQLWNQFKTHTNEMTLTRLGRKLFPVFKISVLGLEANCMYSVALEFVQVDLHRWKHTNGEWVPGLESHPIRSRSETTFTHPDSPNFGAHWMQGVVSFEALKISNRPGRNGQVISLNSLHKYQPCVHITKVEIPAPIKCFTRSFTFVEAQFITVTAYQNEEIINLKIKHNPYAKGPLKRSFLMADSNSSDCDYSSANSSPQMSQCRKYKKQIYSPPTTQFSSNFYTGNEKFEECQERSAQLQWQLQNYGNSTNVILDNSPDLFCQYPCGNYQSLNSHQVQNEDFDLPQPTEDWSHFNTFPLFI